MPWVRVSSVCEWNQGVGGGGLTRHGEISTSEFKFQVRPFSPQELLVGRLRQQGDSILSRFQRVPVLQRRQARPRAHDTGPIPGRVLYSIELLSDRGEAVQSGRSGRFRHCVPGDRVPECV